MLLSQDEARFPMVPTLVRTLGLKGQRPIVGTTDNKDVVYAFASLNVIERLWKLLRRRATHNRLFEALPAMCAALRDSLRYYQVMKCRILSMIRSPRRRPKSHAA